MSELNLKFGQIPFWAICNFGTRSKIEIIVFSFICAKRFRSNGEAECERAEIIEYTGLDKSQVSLAIKKLIKDNWLKARSKTKWFISEIEPEFVEESSTNELENKVVESSTKVVESSTQVEESSTKVVESSTNKSLHIRNSFSSDSSDLRQTNRQINTGASESFVNSDLQSEIEEMLFWLQRQKGLKSKRNFPERDWLTLLTDLVPEGIAGTGFQEFYHWVENLDWVHTVSPKLMRGQIENFKKREQIANKNKQLEVKGNGKIQQHNSNGYESEHQRRDRAARKRIEFDEAADEFLRSQGII